MLAVQNDSTVLYGVESTGVRVQARSFPQPHKLARSRQLTSVESKDQLSQREPLSRWCHAPNAPPNISKVVRTRRAHGFLAARRSLLALHWLQYLERAHE